MSSCLLEGWIFIASMSKNLWYSCNWRHYFLIKSLVTHFTLLAISKRNIKDIPPPQLSIYIYKLFISKNKKHVAFSGHTLENIIKVLWIRFRDQIYCINILLARGISLTNWKKHISTKILHCYIIETKPNLEYWIETIKI